MDLWWNQTTHVHSFNIPFIIIPMVMLNYTYVDKIAVAMVNFGI